MLSFQPPSAITPPLAARLTRAAVAAKLINQHAQYRAYPAGPGGLSRPMPHLKESKMPKLKTKSGAKKRFKITAQGKVKSAFAGKRHGMIKRTKKQIRQHRGTRVLFKADGDNIIKYFLPNG
jgi:large subunit ribosomal protein L35